MVVYYYLHRDVKDLIWRPLSCVENDAHYFDAWFVERVWKVDTKNMQDVWILCIEALALGAHVSCICALASSWDLSLASCKKFLSKYKLKNGLQIMGIILFLKKVLCVDPSILLDDSRIEKFLEGKRREGQ